MRAEWSLLVELTGKGSNQNKVGRVGAGKEGTAIPTGRGLTDRSLLGRRAGWGSLGLWLGS